MKEKTRNHLIEHMRIVRSRLLRNANSGTWNGKLHPTQSPYFMACVHDDTITNMRLVLTRDVEHHTSGWFKNPDYERCYHLSMSSWDSTMGMPVGHLDHKMARLWAEVIFGDDVRLAWVESPKGPEGIKLDVWHWRLFCDEHWQPILPRGEVYTKDFTEKGWRSYSQVKEEDRIEITSPLNPHPE